GLSRRLCCEVPQRDVDRTGRSGYHPWFRRRGGCRSELRADLHSQQRVPPQQCRCAMAREMVEDERDPRLLRPGLANSRQAAVGFENQQRRPPLVPAKRWIPRASIKATPELKHLDPDD